MIRLLIHKWTGIGASFIFKKKIEEKSHLIFIEYVFCEYVSF